MASIGPQNPGTAIDDSSYGTEAWLNPGYVFFQDTDNATASLTLIEESHFLQATNFGFHIPTTPPNSATILGIKVEIRRGASKNNTIYDSYVYLVKDGVQVGNNKAAAGAWSQVASYISYGGSADLWGTTWTAEQINSANFGVAMACGSDGTAIASVDHMRITVTFAGPSIQGISTMQGISTIQF